MAAGAVVTGVFVKGAAANADDCHIVSFPGAASPAYREQRKALLLALRVSSGSPVIVDLSSFHTLDQQDIDLLLKCMAHVTGRDTPLLLVADSCPIQILLEVVRISSLAPVFNSVEEALTFSQIRAWDKEGWDREGKGSIGKTSSEDAAVSQTNNIAEVQE
jgi:hypothetical protein